MPNWGKIGRGLLSAAPLIAAPFTGGASLLAAPGMLGKIGSIAGAAAPVLGGIMEGRAKGQQQDITNQQRQSEQEARLYQAILQAQQGQARLGADRAQFERDSPDVRFQQAMRGNLAQNLQDVQIGGGSPRLQRSLVNYSGGLRPSAIGESGRAAGGQLAQLGSSMMGKDTFNIPDLPAPPQLAGLPKDSILDKILGAAGPAVGFLGALGGGGGQQPPRPMDEVPRPSGGVNPALLQGGSRGLWNPQAPRLQPDGSYLPPSNPLSEKLRLIQGGR